MRGRTSFQTGVALLCWAVLTASGVSSLAQTGPAINWWVVASGGAPASAGGVAVNDTLGQPLIAPASGGAVFLSAGYWFVPPLAPTITSASSATFIVGVPGTFTVTTTGFPTPAVTATGARPGGVTFTDNGDGTATLAGTPASGSAAVYDLDIKAANGVAPDATQDFALTVARITTTTTLVSDTPDPSVVGETVTFSYTVAVVAPGSGTPTGNVTVSDGTNSCAGTVAAGSCTISFTAPGTTNFTAAYAGDTSFAGSTSGTASHTVNQASTTTTLVSDSPDPSVVGETVTFAYTVAVVAPGAGTPTGNVTVSDGTNSCVGTVAAGSCTITFTAPGTTNFTAAYAGDTSFAGSTSGTASHTVNQAPAFTSVDGATFTVGIAGAFTITVNGFPTPAISATGALPGGVSFTDNGDGTASLAGTPAADSAGAYPLTLTAVNGVPPDASQAFVLTVAAGIIPVAGATGWILLLLLLATIGFVALRRAP